MRSRVPSRAPSSAEARRAGSAFFPVAVRGVVERGRLAFAGTFAGVAFFFVIWDLPAQDCHDARSNLTLKNVLHLV